ncbi:MAG: hypothetical protein RLZZ301_49 [Bacteroidota bacterium]|jgi:riboflavin kinase/FMN adenylyltransferase
MELLSGLQSVAATEPIVVTIGTFDGLHLGHQKILQSVIAAAKAIHGKSMLLTFHPHPRRVLFPEKELQLLQTQEEKMESLKALGLDYVMVLEFDAHFAQQSAAFFVDEILIKHIHASQVIIGYDHQFGHSREGNIHFLKAYERQGVFQVAEIPAEQIDEVYISSSKIRHALLDGNPALASSFLGSPYQLSGFVVKGLQNGRKIGFPTANLRLTEQEKLIPANGVYAISASIQGQHYFGMMNIGWRPTVDENKTERKIEAHFFELDLDLYDSYLTLSIHTYIRPEQKFANFEALTSQIKMDEATVRAYFAVV